MHTMPLAIPPSLPLTPTHFLRSVIIFIQRQVYKNKLGVIHILETIWRKPSVTSRPAPKPEQANTKVDNSYY